MGRAPCCDKANVKKGPWSPEEDAKLKSYIEEHGTGGNWIALPQKIGLKRCGKSCRLRWLNYLRPNIKHGAFSEEEEKIICSLYLSIGSRWSIIAAQLPGRTDNDIKNYWNTRLKKKLLGKQRKEHSRRGSNNRSENNMMKKNKSLVGSANPNIDHANHYLINNKSETPYWPELPRPMQILPMFYPKLEESSAFNDQTSLRNLLMKLGGRFSDDHNCESPVMIQNSGTADLQIPIDHGSSSSSSQNPNYHLESSCPIFADSSEIEGSVHQCFGNPHRSFDGLEFLLGGEGINGNWPGEMSYSGFSSSAEVSCDLGAFQQDLLQECSFNVLPSTIIRNPS